jgi:Zn-finger nucleic acid-binding protein
MLCPQCKDELEVIHVDAKDVIACKSCGGMWLHRNQLNEFLADVDGDVEVCSIDNHEHADKYPPMKCLECKDTKMRKINFLEYSDIVFDYCDNCGAYWVKKDQLENMHNYIKKVKDGTFQAKEPMAYHLLVKLSEMAYSIFSS